MQQDLLKQVLTEQHANILKKELGTERNILSIISKKLSIPHVLVITGIRRCGKSTLLRQIIKKYFNDSDFYYINFEDERLLNFEASQFNLIYETLVELFGQKKNFFIDEIQNIENFDSFVRRFYDQGFKFIITGSNARLLSNEIGTRLTGRHIDIQLKPFSFSEFLNYHKTGYSEKDINITETRVNIKQQFQQWLQHGGMPEYLKFDDIEILNTTYNDILIKDIVARYRVEDVKALRELYRYLVSNFANRYSYHSLTKITPIIGTATIHRFINYLLETFFSSEINKFDYSYKKQLANEKKMYICDNGFIKAISIRVTRDSGWLLENVVYNYLSEEGLIYYYSNKGECDFILERHDKSHFPIQVCYNIDPQNQKREIDGLVSAMQFFKSKQGMLITSETEETISNGDLEIIVTPAWKWMVNKENGRISQ
jgi:predicted AAA+ superfamily ATPase